MRPCVFIKRCGIHSDAVISAHFLRYVLFCLIIFTAFAPAKPVHLSEAQRYAHGWLRENRRPMDRPISRQFQSLQPVTDETFGELCYIINLQPEGFVVLAADDEVNPIIAFSPTGFVDASAENPLRALLRNDMKGRLTAVRHNVSDPSKRSRSRSRWLRYTNVQAEGQTGGGDGTQTETITTIDDVRVEPFMVMEWGQEEAAGDWCYNYYTPGHYPCGCVATVMGQLMLYHRWPSDGIGGGYLGGDGSGGPYDWDLMPYVPDDGLTTAERQMIGRLCRDAGEAVDMDYSPYVSLANLADTDRVLVSTFMYSNSIYTANINSSGDNNLWVMMNSNLDAELPVLLAIYRAEGGHAVVADGYGYHDELLYHHLNMGWDGLHNAWYQLPDIDTPLRDYDTVTKCIYNIYPQGNGEIISGRVTDENNQPYPGAVVTAYQGSTPVGQDTTNQHGVYALTHLPSNKEFRISVQANGTHFVDRIVTTGRSINGASISGNRWPIEFTLSASSTFGPPYALDSVVDAQFMAGYNDCFGCD